MPDPTPTPASEGHPAPQGSPGEGTGGGAPAGFVPQSAVDQAEQRRRSTQSALDQEKQKTAALEARLGKVEETLGAFDVNAVTDQFTARFNQQQAIAAERTAAKEKFPLARTSVIDAQYETPEELRQAVESSHKAEDEYRTSVRSEVEKGVYSSIKETHGIDVTPTPQIPPAEGESGGKTPLTEADLAAMPMSDFLALDADVLAAVK